MCGVYNFLTVKLVYTLELYVCNGNTILLIKAVTGGGRIVW